MSNTKTMKIRIESDGTATGTKVVNAETGQAISGVRSIHWDLEVGELPAYATLDQSGPSHLPRFIIEVRLQGYAPETGEAGSKRDAEKAAAQRMLDARLKDPQ